MSKPTCHLPGNIRQAFADMAAELLRVLDEQFLQVELVEPQESRHMGHKLRHAVNTNPTWYKELYESYKPKKFDRACFRRALEAIRDGYDWQCTYHELARKVITGFLAAGFAGIPPHADALSWFDNGVPF